MLLAVALGLVAMAPEGGGRVAGDPDPGPSDEEVGAVVDVEIVEGDGGGGGGGSGEDVAEVVNSSVAIDEVDDPTSVHGRSSGA